MIRVQGYDRRIWLLKAKGGVIRLGLVALVGLGLVALGLFFYQNAFTTILFAFCSLVIVVWLGFKPREVELALDKQMLTIGGRVVDLSTADSWSLVDLAEKALLIFRLQPGGGYVELYVDKAELTHSGLVNELTQKLAYNPNLDTSNVLYMVLRLLNLY
jgi:hypothetical protein